ncbi:hypothetical protein ACFW04_007249 [Cataglyphis niger]
MELDQLDRPPVRESVCPKYVFCDCPEIHLNDRKKCFEVDVDYTIEKLQQLVSDPVTSDHVERISRLLYHYLREIGDEGYLVKHLPAVTKVLEFLAWKSREVSDYRVHLYRMLHLCNRPPLLKRTSESLVSLAIMEHYFTTLGYLLIILPNEEEIQQVQEALDCLLIERKKATNVAAIKLDLRRRAMENSKLPTTIVELLEAALPRIYPKILKVTFILASISSQCCYKMLEAGILNTLLTRMDLPYATLLHCMKPPNMPIEGQEYSKDTMLLKMKLLWSLMRSVLPPNKLPESLKNLSSPKQCAMWGLKYSFNRQIIHGQYCAVNLKIRNDIIALIFAGIVALPSWNLISSGIAEDIIDLLSVIESGITKIWTKDIKFLDSDDNFFFKRILLMIIAYFAEIDVYVFIMKKMVIMPVILRIIKTCMKNKKIKESSLSLILLEHALYILSLLAPRMKIEFIKFKGTYILSAILDVLNTEFDEHLAMIVTRTICSITLQEDALLLEDFRRHEMITLIIKLINNILGLKKFTMIRQRILTLLLIALENLMKKQTSVQQIYGKQSIEFVMKIFRKYLYKENENFQVDQRLLLAIGSYVWECVARCSMNLEIFLKSGGLYFMLDIIEIASYPVRCLYLGALTDICDQTFCGPCLCTWRGADKKTGLISLLAIVWRKEEDRIGVKRRADGSITDPELPQMGTKQWTDTYRSQLTADASPTIIDMIGSTRSKIFSILKIIERDGDKYQIARKHYKILLHELPIKDRVTLCCIDMYLRLKLGQMWTELSRYLEHAGITPLIVDAHLIAHMVQWHRSWGILIKENQKKLIAAIKIADEIAEREELVKIRDSKLAPTLDALNEVDRIRRTTERSYMLRKKDQQRRQVDAALSFPFDADEERCHRTYSDKANVTPILRQHQSIDSSHLGDLRDSIELLPVSPEDSLREETFSSFITVSNDSYSYECQLAKEYLIESLNH